MTGASDLARVPYTQDCPTCMSVIRENATVIGSTYYQSELISW